MTKKIPDIGLERRMVIGIVSAEPAKESDGMNGRRAVRIYRVIRAKYELQTIIGDNREPDWRETIGKVPK